MAIVARFNCTWFHFTYAFTVFFPRTPRSAGSAQGYTQYEWTSPGSKPSSPFIALEKKKEALTERSKPRPGTAEAEIEGTFAVFLNDNTALLELTENMSIQSHSELNFR